MRKIKLAVVRHDYLRVGPGHSSSNGWVTTWREGANYECFVNADSIPIRPKDAQGLFFLCMKLMPEEHVSHESDDGVYMEDKDEYDTDYMATQEICRQANMFLCTKYPDLRLTPGYQWECEVSLWSALHE